MRHWREIEFPAKQFTTRFDFAALVVSCNCHLLGFISCLTFQAPNWLRERYKWHDSSLSRLKPCIRWLSGATFDSFLWFGADSTHLFFLSVSRLVLRQRCDLPRDGVPVQRCERRRIRSRAGVRPLGGAVRLWWRRRSWPFDLTQPRYNVSEFVEQSCSCTSN